MALSDFIQRCILQSSCGFTLLCQRGVLLRHSYITHQYASPWDVGIMRYCTLKVCVYAHRFSSALLVSAEYFQRLKKEKDSGNVLGSSRVPSFLCVSWMCPETSDS